MRGAKLVLTVVGLLVSLAAMAQFSLRGQTGVTAIPGAPPPASIQEKGPTSPALHPSIQDALLRPYRFDFRRPTTLAELVTRLGKDLAAPVVLDLAALNRLEIEPDETVSLELDGVRLKTGLKLLLDQAGLTYRVVAEDNLLVLTDREGAEDPVERLSAEVRELHRDVHDLQDAVDELRELSGGDSLDEGARVRKPTIIEELPEHPEMKERGNDETPSAKPAPGSEPVEKPRNVPSGRRRTALRTQPGPRD